MPETTKPETFSKPEFSPQHPETLFSYYPIQTESRKNSHTLVNNAAEKLAVETFNAMEDGFGRRELLFSLQRIRMLLHAQITYSENGINFPEVIKQDLTLDDTESYEESVRLRSAIAVFAQAALSVLTHEDPDMFWEVWELISDLKETIISYRQE